MKKLLKITAVICLVAMLLTLTAACGNTPSNPTAAPQDDKPADLPHYKIGLVAFTNTGLWWERCYDAVNALAKEFNCEVSIAYGDTPDAVIAAVENLCSAGVDGIIAMATGGVTPRLVEICQASNTYLVGGYNDCTIDAGYESIASNPYWVGNVYFDEYATSYSIAQDMINNGAKNFVIFGLPPGISTSFDLRATGAMKAVEDAGLTSVEVRSFALPEIANTFLTQYPDTDAVYSIMYATTYITNPIMSAGYAGKLQVSTYDDEGDTVAAFDSGLLTHATEGGNAQAQVCFALLYNALGGAKLTNADGTAPHILLPYNVMKSSAEYTIFLEHSTNGKYPYSLDEVKAMMKAYNPDVTVESIEAFTSVFSTEWLANH